MFSLKEYIKRSIGFDKLWLQLNQKIDSQKILSAKLLIAQNNKLEKINSLSDVEFSVFSQMGDDGIIQWLINKIAIPEKLRTFIEFGVENYTESNTRFLLVNNNWSGFVMDGSEKNVNFIKNDFISWQFDLTSKAVFVNTKNINDEIKTAGFSGEIGILHIDIDGNEYWIWDAIDIVNPIIVIVEYNSAFGNERAITIPYDPAFISSKSHYSRIYYGVSIKALDHLAAKKGYTFVGCNSSGINAYFVRNDYADRLVNAIERKEFVAAALKQNRNEDGSLSYKKDVEIIKTIHKEVINVITNKAEPLNN